MGTCFATFSTLVNQSAMCFKATAYSMTSSELGNHGLVKSLYLCNIKSSTYTHWFQCMLFLLLCVEEFETFVPISLHLVWPWAWGWQTNCAKEGRSSLQSCHTSSWWPYLQPRLEPSSIDANNATCSLQANWDNAENMTACAESKRWLCRDILQYMAWVDSHAVARYQKKCTKFDWSLLCESMY